MEFGEDGNDALFRNEKGTLDRKCSLFLRLLGKRAGKTRYLVRTLYEHQPDQWRVMSALPVRWDENGAQIVFPAAGDEVIDFDLKLDYLRIGGNGLHAITVHFRSEFDPEYDDPIEPTEGIDESRPWQDADEWEKFPSFHHLATDTLPKK